MDKHTFGGTKASETLVNILNVEYPRCIRKVARNYNKFNFMLRQIYSLHKSCEKGDVRHFLTIYKKDIFVKMDDLLIPEILKTYMQCVMTAEYRSYLRKLK